MGTGPPLSGVRIGKVLGQRQLLQTRRFDHRHLGLVLAGQGELDHPAALHPVGWLEVVGQHRPGRRRPHVAERGKAEHPKLVQVAAGHKGHTPLVEQIGEAPAGPGRHKPLPRRRRQLGFAGGQRFMGDEGDRVADRLGENALEPRPLGRLGVQTGAEQLGVDADQGPAADVGPPPVGPDGIDPPLATRPIHLGPRRPFRSQVVADVMVSRHRPPLDR